MFYSKEMINNLGYTDIIDFIQDYMKQHSNCCIIYRPNGVYIYTDFYTTIIGSNGEVIKDSF